MTSFDLTDDALVRVLAGVVLGAIIGIEREATDQPAGLRTHIAVCMGAALFGVVSTLGFAEFAARRAETNFQVDVTRVASQVVVGIGFLGAGMIFRQGTAVRNLTTAASLWAVAAIGLAAGVGDIGTAAIGTALLLVSLVALKPLRTLVRRVNADGEKATIRVRVRDGAPQTMVMDLLDARAVVAECIAYEKERGQHVLVIALKGTNAELRSAEQAIAAHDLVDDLTIVEGTGRGSVAAEGADDR